MKFLIEAAERVIKAIRKSSCESVVSHDLLSLSSSNELVDLEYAIRHAKHILAGSDPITCVRCGESNPEQLLWLEDNWIDCQNCGTSFDPTTGSTTDNIK